MKKNYKYLALDFVKSLRDTSVDESLRRSSGTVVDKMLNNINLIDYLIFEMEFYK